jgi:hypothetical protein
MKLQSALWRLGKKKYNASLSKTKIIYNPEKPPPPNAKVCKNLLDFYSKRTAQTRMDVTREVCPL